MMSKKFVNDVRLIAKRRRLVKTDKGNSFLKCSHKVMKMEKIQFSRFKNQESVTSSGVTQGG